MCFPSVFNLLQLDHFDFINIPPIIWKENGTQWLGGNPIWTVTILSTVVDFTLNCCGLTVIILRHSFDSCICNNSASWPFSTMVANNFGSDQCDFNQQRLSVFKIVSRQFFLEDYTVACSNSNVLHKWGLQTAMFSTTSMLLHRAPSGSSWQIEFNLFLVHYWLVIIYRLNFLFQ